MHVINENLHKACHSFNLCGFTCGKHAEKKPNAAATQFGKTLNVFVLFIFLCV